MYFYIRPYEEKYMTKSFNCLTTDKLIHFDTCLFFKDLFRD